MRLNIFATTALLTASVFLGACATGGEARNTDSGEDWIAKVHFLADEMRLDMNASGNETIAVLDFSTDEGYTNFAKALNEELTAAFRKAGIRVVEREAIDTVMAEQQFQLSGLVTDETAKSVGRIIGVDMICFGRIADFPDFVRVSCRVIEVESGELLSIKNIELAKTPRLLAYLSGGNRQGAAGNAQPEQNSKQAQNPTTASANTTAVTIPESRPALDLSGDEFETEAGQIAAVRRFIPFVVDNLWDISIVSVEPIGNSRSKPDEYSVKLTWEFKERQETVRAMADFYRRFPAQAGPRSTGGGNLVLNYYPTPYASSSENIAIKMNSNAERLMRSRVYAGFYWYVTFTLLDKGGLPIDRLSGVETRITLSSSPTRLGRIGQTREHTFRMSREAYENMDTVRIADISGGIPQGDGSLFVPRD